MAPFFSPWSNCLRDMRGWWGYLASRRRESTLAVSSTSTSGFPRPLLARIFATRKLEQQCFYPVGLRSRFGRRFDRRGCCGAPAGGQGRILRVKLRHPPKGGEMRGSALLVAWPRNDRFTLVKPACEQLHRVLRPNLAQQLTG